MAGIDIIYRVRQSTLKTGLAQSKRSLDTFSKDINRQFAALGGIGLTAGLTMLTKKAIDLGSALSDSATRTRTNVEAYQALDYAQRIAGGSSGALERALRNVSNRTEEAANGNKTYLEALQRLGLANNEFISLPTEMKLEQLAKAYTSAENQSRAFADVSIILGERAGPELTEVLGRLATEGLDGVSEAAREAGEVIDKDLIVKLDEAADKIQGFQRRAQVGAAEGLGWFQAFGEGLGAAAGMATNYLTDPDSRAGFRDQAERQLQREGAFDNLQPVDRGWLRWGRSVESQKEDLIRQRTNYLFERSQMQSEVAAVRDRVARRAEVQAGAQEARDAKARGETPPRRRNRRSNLTTFGEVDPFTGEPVDLSGDPFAGIKSAAQAVRALQQATGGGISDRPGADADEFRRVGIALTGSAGAVNPEQTKQTDLLRSIDQHIKVVAQRAEESGLQGQGDLATFAV